MGWGLAILLFPTPNTTTVWWTTTQRGISPWGHIKIIRERIKPGRSSHHYRSSKPSNANALHTPQSRGFSEEVELNALEWVIPAYSNWVPKFAAHHPCNWNDPVCNFDYLHILTVTFNCPIIGVNFRLLEVAGSNHLDLRPLRFEDRHHSIWQSHYI